MRAESGQGCGERGRESRMGLTPVRLGAQQGQPGASLQASDELLAELEVPGGPPETGGHQEEEQNRGTTCWTSSPFCCGREA